MNYAIDFSHRGLRIYAWLAEYHPATRMQPEEGGTVERIQWMIDDLDEVLDELEVWGRFSRWIMGVYVRYYRKLPPRIARHIEKTWDLEEEASDFFWDSVGGPEQYQDYCYEG